MSFGVSALIIIFVLYILLVKGMLWKILVGVFAFLGMHTFILYNFNNAKHVCFTIGTTTFSWATAISLFVILMASLYTKE